MSTNPPSTKAPVAKLTLNQIEMAIREVPDWKINSAGEIEKTFTCTGFPQALLFVNSVGLMAESKAHHPDIFVQWNKVRLTLTTHDANGLSEKDFELAKLVNTLPHI